MIIGALCAALPPAQSLSSLPPSLDSLDDVVWNRLDPAAGGRARRSRIKNLYVSKEPLNKSVSIGLDGALRHLFHLFSLPFLYGLSGTRRGGRLTLNMSPPAKSESISDRWILPAWQHSVTGVRE